MSNIAEKLITIAKNQNGIYHAGATRFAATNTTEKSDSITVTDSSDYKMLDFGLEGKTEQKTYTGKNLFDVSKAKNIDNWGSGVYKYLPLNLPPGTYTWSMSANNVCKENANAVALSAGCYLTTNPGVVGGNVNIGNSAVSNTSGSHTKTKQFTVNAGESWYINLYVKSLTEQNLVIVFDELLPDIQIELGSTATEYEPYCGGTSSPNPNYPQDIVNAGTIRGNMFDKSYAADKNNWKASDSEYYFGLPVYVGKGKKLTIKYHNTVAGGLNMYACVCNNNQYNSDNNNKQWIYHATLTANNNIVRYITSISDYIYIFCIKDALESDDFMKYIGNYLQIEEGTKATEYKDYKGYEIGCSLSGTNLFDNVIREPGGLYNLEGVWGDNANYNTYYLYNTKGAGPYKASQYIGGIRTFWDSDGNFISGSSVDTNATMTFPDGAVLCKFAYHVNNLDKEHQIVLGTSLPVYSPYVPEKSFTLTSPVQLTKWDKLVKRDGVWGWSVYSYKLVVDGNAKWSGYLVDQGFYESSNMVKDKSNMRESYCNALSVGNTAGVNRIAIGYSNQFIYVGHVSFFDDTLADKGLANWKAYLNENPLEIWTYSDVEQSFHPLPDDEQKLLNSLETNYAGTMMYNDQGCPMWFEYIIDPELYGGEF